VRARVESNREGKSATEFEDWLAEQKAKRLREGAAA
jgi:hypothetical protein